MTLLVRAALASAALPNKVAYGTRALLSGTWLGVLSDERMRELDELYYARTPVFMTDEWNERGLFDWEHELIGTHFPSKSSVAVIAAGGGREVLALRRAGYDAVGFESHPDLVTFGRDFLAGRGHADAARPVPRDGFPQDGGPWNAVVVGWGAYTAVHGRARRVELLRSIRRGVSSGVPVLLSGVARDSDYREARVTAAVANGIRRVLGRPLVDLGDTLNPNRLHLFTEREVTAEALEAGFDLAEYRVTGEADRHMSYAAAVLTARA